MANPAAILPTRYHSAIHEPHWLEPEFWALQTAETLLSFARGPANYRPGPWNRCDRQRIEQSDAPIATRNLAVWCRREQRTDPLRPGLLVRARRRSGIGLAQPDRRMPGSNSRVPVPERQLTRCEGGRGSQRSSGLLDAAIDPLARTRSAGWVRAKEVAPRSPRRAATSRHRLLGRRSRGPRKCGV